MPVFVLPPPIARPTADPEEFEAKFTKRLKNGRRLLDSFALPSAAPARAPADVDALRLDLSLPEKPEKSQGKVKTPRGSLAIGLETHGEITEPEVSEDFLLLSSGKPQLPPCVRSIWRPRLAPVQKPSMTPSVPQTPVADSVTKTTSFGSDKSKSILKSDRRKKGSAKSIFDGVSGLKSRRREPEETVPQANEKELSRASSLDTPTALSPKSNPSELIGIIRKSVVGGGRATGRATIVNQGDGEPTRRTTQLVVPGQSAPDPKERISVSRENHSSRVGEPRMSRHSRVSDLLGPAARMRRSQLAVPEDDEEEGTGGFGHRVSGSFCFSKDSHRTSEDLEEPEDTGSPRTASSEGPSKQFDAFGLAGSSPSNKTRVEERMRRLDLKRLQKLRQDRQMKQRELKQQRFNELPETEAEAIRSAFMLFDMDNSGYLDQREVVLCLQEFGMRGMTSTEKREIMNICRQATSALTVEENEEDKDIAVDLLEFALTVVPQVRSRLVELRGDNMLKEFFKFDTDGSGKLSKREIKELARGMGIDPQMIERETDWMKADDEVDFETFQEMICKGYEQLNRAIRERERQVQISMGLDESVFLDFRGDLVSLYDTFRKFDIDGSGTLSKSEIMPMLKEFGLMPQNQTEKEDVQKILTACDADTSQEFNFPEFLDCIREIRKYKQGKEAAKHTQLFEKYDRDESGYLNAGEISKLIEDLGLCPKNRQEQDQLAYLMAQVDEDGSGYIDFVEFQGLCQRIDEKLKIFRYEEELEYAMSLGFSEVQLRDLRWVFDTLDVDSSQKLDEHEVKSGLVMMRKHVSPDAFQAAFKSLDKDGSGEFDFLEFLMFMKMMHEGEEETQKLAPRAKSLDVRVLRRVLEYFRISKTYANSLSKNDLVGLFCDYFEITPNTNLADALHVSTVAELYEAAKKQDLKLQTIGK